MIDWFSLLANGLWLLGLALLLAAASYHAWEAEEQGRPLRAQLQQPAFLRAAWPALLLTGLGLAATSPAAWQAALWLLWCGLAALNTVLVWRRPLGDT